jgi:hypothetical protein
MVIHGTIHTKRTRKYILRAGINPECVIMTTMSELILIVEIVFIRTNALIRNNGRWVSGKRG